MIQDQVAFWVNHIIIEFSFSKLWNFKSSWVHINPPFPLLSLQTAATACLSGLETQATFDRRPLFATNSDWTQLSQLALLLFCCYCCFGFVWWFNNCDCFWPVTTAQVATSSDWTLSQWKIAPTSTSAIAISASALGGESSQVHIIVNIARIANAVQVTIWL